MKKTNSKNQKIVSTAIITAALCAGSLGFSLNAFGATSVSAQLTPDFTIVVDGTERTFYSATGNEAHPIVYNGTTYLPIRAIGELMGKNVNWDQSTLTISISGVRNTPDVKGTPDKYPETKKITAQIQDDFKIVVDGVTQKFTDANGDAVYPLLYNGSTYLPLRSIGELMGKTVSWNAKTETITLSGDDSSIVTDADSFNNSSNNNNKNMISLEDAKNEALSHAGVKSNKVNFVKANLDWDNGRQIYEIEFYTNNYEEYDYEIDAYTGEVISYDFDAENYKYTKPNNNNNSNNSSYISEDKAKRIALDAVSGASEKNVVKVEFDYDDGRAEYDVKIVYNYVEHEFEIDAVTGNILSRDSESIYD